MFGPQRYINKSIRHRRRSLDFRRAHDAGSGRFVRLHSIGHGQLLGMMLPRMARTPIDGRQIFSVFSVGSKLILVTVSSLFLRLSLRIRVESDRWRPPLFTLFPTIISTTGSCVTTIGTRSVTIRPERKPSWPRRRPRENCRRSSSFISQTAERTARALQGAGSRDGSELDPTGAAGDRHTLTPSTRSRAHASNWGNDTAPDWRAISLP